MTPKEWFAQAGSRCKLDWGLDGARAAAARNDLMIVVDVLCFSTAVITAVNFGAAIIPRADGPGATPDPASAPDTILAVHRDDVPLKGRFSLSPITFIDIEAGSRVTLPSLNGGGCCACASPASPLFIGALVNAGAAARAATDILAKEPDRNVTVIACGERWNAPDRQDALRFAAEDYLGAGAILANIPFSRSVEAEMCAAAFSGMRNRLDEALSECGSGIELRDRGYGEDVRHSARLDLYTVVPRLVNGILEGQPTHG